MLSTKKLFTILLLLCLQASTATSAQAAAADANEKVLTLKWLGNAGWEIQFGPTVILIDPFLTRGEASHGAEWKTDEEAVRLDALELKLNQPVRVKAETTTSDETARWDW